MRLIDDWGFDPELARALEGAAGGRNALGDGFHSPSDVVKVLALAKLLTKPAVAAVRAETGRNQVADATQTLKGARLSAHRHPEANQLSNRASDERRFGIITETEPVANSGRNGENILQRPTELDAYDLVTRINPES